MFRSVELPTVVSGKLILHSMPGRYEDLQETWKQIEAETVRLIVSLAPLDEIRSKSPVYAQALETHATPCAVDVFPISDRGVPDDRASFWSLASKVAERLRSGDTVLIHCGAGIGRTGTLAISILVALGEPVAAATKAVAAARSHPETDAQRKLVAWCASRRAER